MGFIERGLLLYLVMAIACVFIAPTIIFNGSSPADSTVLSWFNIEYTNNEARITSATLSSDANNATNNLAGAQTSATSGLTLLSIFDPIGQFVSGAVSWFKLFFKVLFSPIVLLSSPEFSGMHPAVMFIFGIIPVFLVIIGIIVFIRSGAS